MPTRDRSEFEEIDLGAMRREANVEHETSRERFDRMAFAEELVRLLRPRTLTVALCVGRAGVTVEAGRDWGKGEGARWAVVRVPPTASRRAIATAVAGLATPPHRPYVLDTLLGVAAVARSA